MLNQEIPNLLRSHGMKDMINSISYGVFINKEPPHPNVNHNKEKIFDTGALDDFITKYDCFSKYTIATKTEDSGNSIKEACCKLNENIKIEAKYGIDNTALLSGSLNALYDFDQSISETVNFALKQKKMLYGTVKFPKDPGSRLSDCLLKHVKDNL